MMIETIPPELCDLAIVVSLHLVAYLVAVGWWSGGAEITERGSNIT